MCERCRGVGFFCFGGVEGGEVCVRGVRVLGSFVSGGEV